VQLIGFRLAGGGGREVHVNPEQVVCIMDVGVCIMDVGERRTQIVTTGLSGETSMSLIVEAAHSAVVRALLGERGAARVRRVAA
jgi:hypothetical protein